MQRREANEQSNVVRRADTTVAPQLWTRPGANIPSGGDTTESSTDREKELEQQLKKYQEKFKREKEERKKLKTEHGRKVSGETNANEYERVVEYVKEQLFRSVKFITMKG